MCIYEANLPSDLCVDIFLLQKQGESKSLLSKLTRTEGGIASHHAALWVTLFRIIGDRTPGQLGASLSGYCAAVNFFWSAVYSSGVSTWSNVVASGFPAHLASSASNSSRLSARANSVTRAEIANRLPPSANAVSSRLSLFFVAVVIIPLVRRDAYERAETGHLR